MVEARNPQRRLPDWLKVSLAGARPRHEVRKLLQRLDLHTVCESALCPNLCECWARGTATFMILGDHCTRNCRFCAVTSGPPTPPMADEPERIAAAVTELGLKYVVLTSVTRDDLQDGGAQHFARTVRTIRAAQPQVGIEVLTPDFNGVKTSIATVLAAAPKVFNHNLETCARLTPQIRGGADYQRSLNVLAMAREIGKDKVLIKSGFMLGLGESDAEVEEMLHDLRSQGVGFVTIGQYLPPSTAHWPVARYVTPEEFERWAALARDRFGFEFVASAPRVRSSYLADTVHSAAANTGAEG